MKPSLFTSNVDILDYRPEHQPWFESLNREWIEKYFWMEPIDVAVLQHPEDHIIRTGGNILMIQVDREIAGTAALKFVKPGVYEFTKMAVDKKFRGRGLGRALAEAAIEKAKTFGAHTIILYSNRILENAIMLYRKLGFIELPVDGLYARSDIKMQLVLDHTKNPALYSIRRATLQDASLLCVLGRKTFEETFKESNTPEDLALFLTENFTVEKLSIEIQETGSIFLIAFDADREVGFARLRENKMSQEKIEVKNALEIERLYTVKTYIGKQVGRSLMEACFDLARVQQRDAVWLGVWEHNFRAIAFYEKFGFEKIGSHPFIVGKDVQKDLLMLKSLL